MNCLTAFILWAAGVLLVAGETLREVPRVQLAGELNVGFELVARCSTVQYESGQLCSGREPYTLYGDTTSGCSSYFWCSPEHAACIMSCPTGTIFNEACKCCQESATAAAAAFDASACSTAHTAPTTQQVAAADPVAPARKLLGDEDFSTSATTETTLGPTATEEEVRTARAKARHAKRKQREAALRAAAAVSGAATMSDSISSISEDSVSSISQPPLAKRRIARRYGKTSEWNSFGKRYSGRWAAKNVVKEPAVGVARSTAEATASSAAVAEAVTESAAVAGTARHLLDTASATKDPAATSAFSSTTDAPAADPSSFHAAAATKRAMKIKCVHRIAVQAAAAAATAGDPAQTAATAAAIEQQVHGGEIHKFNLRHKMLPMDKKPAAKSIDPEDEKQAPFAAALALLRQ